MKADLEKITNLGNELKSVLETSNKFVKDSWLENYENWLKVYYDDTHYVLCNIYFELNNTKYFLVFPWEEIGINNPKNKTQVTKSENRRLFKDQLEIWNKYSDKNNMWLITVFPKTDKFKSWDTNRRICTYDTLVSYFRKKL